VRDQRVGLPCVHVAGDFSGPLRFGDDVMVETRVAKFAPPASPSRSPFVAATAPMRPHRYVVACADLDGQETPLPDDLRVALEQHVTT